MVNDVDPQLNSSSRLGRTLCYLNEPASGPQMRKKKPQKPNRTDSPVNQADGVTGIVTGRWEQDTIGDVATGTPGGGRFYRSGLGLDKDLGILK